jgi:hypothetical protein
MSTSWEALPAGLAKPTMGERLLPRLQGLGSVNQIRLEVIVGGRIDAGALITAVERVLNEYPRLRLRFVRGVFGYERRLASITREAAARLVHQATTRQGVFEALRSPLDLAAEGPFRVAFFSGDEESFLSITLNHAIADLQALQTVGLRLGARYAEALGGAAPEPVPAPTDTRFRHHVEKLPPADRKAAKRAVWAPIRQMLNGPPKPVATFLDQPLPTGGDVKRELLALTPERVRELTAWAKERNGSFGQLLTAAVTAAAVRVWPQDPALPVVIDIPVSLRTDPADVAEHTVGHFLRLEGTRELSFEALFDRVRQGMQGAREKTPAIIARCEMVIPSLLPPPLFEVLAAPAVNAKTNTMVSFGVTTLPKPATPWDSFGPLTVRDYLLFGDPITPPGLRFTATPGPRSTNVAIAYCCPAIAEESARKLTQEIDSVLRSLQAGAPVKATA